MVIHTEPPEAADSYRADYAAGVERFIKEQNALAKQARTAFMPPENFPAKIEHYREMFLQMLGISRLPDSGSPQLKQEFSAADDVCSIYRVTVTVLGCIPFYGLLMVPHGVSGAAKAPLIIAQHGGGGTPELAADFHGKNNYGHLIQRLLARGAVVFAPQLLLWNQGETFDTCPGHKVPYDRTGTDCNLKRMGLSITGLEIYCISQSVTALSALDAVDETAVGMAGLSYGGYYTLYTMAADTRIKSGLACGCFNDRDCYPWQDMTYFQSGTTFQDAEVAALCAPRRLYVSIGEKDPVFTFQTALPEAKRVKPYYKAFGADHNFVFETWSGEHTVNPAPDGFDFLFSAFK